MDTVAAVCIARSDRTPGERYYDHEDRALIAALRRRHDSWDNIAALSGSELQTALNNASNRPSVSKERVDRLNDLLVAVRDCDRTTGITLNDFTGAQYQTLANTLATFPGISKSDAWWLLLVAFDCPVWPASPHIDTLLCSLGLLDPHDHQTSAHRRTDIEDLMTSRELSALHRALAGHTLKGDTDTCNESCAIRKFLLTHRLREQTHAEAAAGPTVIDLFCGAGGISLGFDQAGYQVKWALDNNEAATDTYRLNHPEIPHRDVICEDIRAAIADGVLDRLECQPDILVGGPPCQSLSQAGYRSRLADDDGYSILDDDRTALYKEYVKFVEALHPKLLVLENVEGMVNEVKDTGVKVADLVIEALESINTSAGGYKCAYRLIDCSELGVPQERNRVIIIGLRNDLVDDTDDVTNLFDSLLGGTETPTRTLRQALSGLPKLRRGEGGRVVTAQRPGVRSRYVTEKNLESSSGLCFNHRAREHPMEKDQTLFEEALEPGETGWEVKYAKNGDYSDLIEYDVGTADNPRFKDKYRMLEWDEPAPTIVAHLAKDSNSFVLPDYYEYVINNPALQDPARNRGITPREAARVQSFPDDYIFLGPFTSWFRQIGNAIPPLLGKQLATQLKPLLESPVTRAETPHRSSPEHATDD
ncbi:DNA cytosine methyltransferase [Halorubrum sp. AS12]|uniref:DNA cytosine methyltransferase n=1 Tax=Halorubrum sp. AS12 TaxID=3409687 RepID=UPI003DA74F41